MEPRLIVLMFMACIWLFFHSKHYFFLHKILRKFVCAKKISWNFFFAWIFWVKIFEMNFFSHNNMFLVLTDQKKSHDWQNGQLRFTNLTLAVLALVENYVNASYLLQAQPIREFQNWTQPDTQTNKQPAFNFMYID